MKRFILSIELVCALGLSITGCAAQDGVRNTHVPVVPKIATFACDNAQFLKDQSAFKSGTTKNDQFVDVCGTVTSVLPEEDTKSGHHGYFYIQIASGVTIEIVSDLDQMTAPTWPWVQVGDYAYAQGRYYYDSESSQGIDWTHHGTSKEWPHAGYVVINGAQYQ